MPNTYFSRRQALINAMRLATAAGISLSLMGAARAQQAKVAQKAAGYQDQPQSNHRCAICTHFSPPNLCNVVDGQISPNGWCRLFAPKMG